MYWYELNSGLKMSVVVNPYQPIYTTFVLILIYVYNRLHQTLSLVNIPDEKHYCKRMVVCWFIINDSLLRLLLLLRKEHWSIYYIISLIASRYSLFALLWRKLMLIVIKRII